MKNFLIRWLKRLSWILLVIALLIIIAVLLFYYSLTHRQDRRFGDSWVFKENQVGPVVGNLGGIQVSIPHYFARFVEYEGDPHFLKPRQGLPSTRNVQSNLRSFGFEVRFPDMAPVTNETWKEKRQSTIHNTMWMSVGVHIAPYNNQLGLQRMVAAIPSKLRALGHGY